jgi:holin-like protein
MANTLSGITLLLVLQVFGEGISRSLHLPIPGPMVGFVLAVIVLRLSSRLNAAMASAANALLPNLSLLFIPAGVGMVMYLHELQRDGVAIAVALVVSVWMGLAVTAWVAEKLSGHDEGDSHET